MAFRIHPKQLKSCNIWTFWAVFENLKIILKFPDIRTMLEKQLEIAEIWTF